MRLRIFRPAETAERGRLPEFPAAPAPRQRGARDRSHRPARWRQHDGHDRGLSRVRSDHPPRAGAWACGRLPRQHVDDRTQRLLLRNDRARRPGRDPYGGVSAGGGPVRWHAAGARHQPDCLRFSDRQRSACHRHGDVGVHGNRPAVPRPSRHADPGRRRARAGRTADNGCRSCARGRAASVRWPGGWLQGLRTCVGHGRAWRPDRRDTTGRRGERLYVLRVQAGPVSVTRRVSARSQPTDRRDQGHTAHRWGWRRSAFRASVATRHARVLCARGSRSIGRSTLRWDALPKDISITAVEGNAANPCASQRAAGGIVLHRPTKASRHDDC